MRAAMRLKQLMSDSDTAMDENWMVSYIDVFVLMTTLFVLLLFLQQPKWGIGEGAREQEALPAEDIFEQLASLPATAAGDVSAQTAQESSFEEVLLTSIRDHGLQPHVQVRTDANATELEIASRVLFDSGDAELTRAGVDMLERLTPVLAQTEGLIFIEGHTDDRPIETAKYPSNWELAAARATEVLQFFVLEGLDEQRFRAVSFADTKPLVPNTSSINRQKNRRVSLVIQKTGERLGSL
ncbi:MAG: OmpA family protein [Oleiphilaceae bacterium]|nr:OmpA family protein [Oleiphilaceae bacterium]